MKDYRDYCASVSPSLADKLCDDERVYSFPLKGTAKIRGDGLWGGEAAVAKVTEITFKITMYNMVELPSLYIDVEHNRPWDIYTDDGFVAGVKKLVRDKLDLSIPTLDFTEQGMQEDCCASMEVSNEDTLKVLKWLQKKGKLPANFSEWLDAYSNCYNEVKRMSSMKRVKDAYSRGYKIRDEVVKRLEKNLKHLED